MGSRNSDRIPLAARRAKFETVGDMIRGGWRVQAWCGACHAQRWVDLKLVAALRGEGFSLWDRASPCRGVGCKGRVRFYAEPSDRPGLRPAGYSETPAGRAAG